VMAAIGEALDEVGCIEEESRPHNLPFGKVVARSLQAADHPLDHAMLIHQNLCRLHETLLLPDALDISGVCSLL
jgi:hypothetical protein